MGERRTSRIERMVRRVEEHVEEWRKRDATRHAEAEANRDELWAAAAERERMLAELVSEEEARRESVEEVMKEHRVASWCIPRRSPRRFRPLPMKRITWSKRSPALGETTPRRWVSRDPGSSSKSRNESKCVSVRSDRSLLRLLRHPGTAGQSHQLDVRSGGQVHKPRAPLGRVESQK